MPARRWIPAGAVILSFALTWSACAPPPSPTVTPPTPEVTQDDTRGSDVDYAQTYVNLGHELYYASRHADAIDQYRLALSINPYNDEAHASIGMAHYKLGKREQAEASFGRALRFNPQNVLARNGIALVTQDETIRVEQLEAAIVIDPEQPELRNNLCYSCAQGGDYDRAVEECREAIRLDSSSAYSHYNLGYAYQRQGRLDRALAEYQIALRQRPGWARVMNNMGLVYYYKSQFAEAINQYENALAANGDEPTFYYNLALAYEAIAARMQTHQQRNEPLPSTYGTIGESDWRSLYRHAAAQLRTYLRITPEAPDASRVRAKMNELRRRAS